MFEFQKRNFIIKDEFFLIELLIVLNQFENHSFV
jgi:hypothetical protein